jgi:uncharacterized protein
MGKEKVGRRWLLPAAGVAVLLAVMLFLGRAGEPYGFEIDEEPWALDISEVEALIEAAVEAGTTATLDWRVLGQLDYRNGTMSSLLAMLDGRSVRLPGFLVPLEDYAEEYSEFLVVPYYGACIHTPPPPPNQMVHGLTLGGQKLRATWWDPVWVVGTLHVETVESPYGVVSFQMGVEALEPFVF